MAPFPIVVAGEPQFEEARAVLPVGKITLLGPLTQERLACLFLACSIYIVTSIYEPFGLAPLEAALCGCAVLASDIPSLREVWGSSALYFQDAASLTQLLNYMHTRPEALREARTKSHQRAHQLSAARMVMEYEGLYRELVAHDLDLVAEAGNHAC